MGLLVDGVWQDKWYDTRISGGRFVRADSQFRHWVTPDGAPGPSGEGGFRAEPGRYHLYVSLACPWAHRTLIFRALKGLEDMIGLSVVHWRMFERGWTFEDGPGVIPDTETGASVLHQVYTAAQPTYSGRVTVPILWDRQRRTIVNNESSEIIRMFNSAFDGVGARPGDFYPAAQRDEIDALNARIYATVNNGVYRAGFATTQEAYEEAIGPLFETLDWLDGRLSDRRFLCGDDYPALSGYLRDLYQWPSVAGTVNMAHIKGHYYESHRTINPTGIVPLGPVLDLESPPRRESLGSAG
jgi:putative glutathione S-transferase